MPRPNQLSRYGAISKVLEEVSPSARVFLVSDSDNAWTADFLHEFPTDEFGVVRSFSSIADTNLMNMVEANRGDVILVMPGHSENITAALAVNKAGVQIIGLGKGDNRPRFNITGSEGIITISGAGARLSNCIIRSYGVYTRGINVTAAGVEVDHNRFDHDSAGDYFTRTIYATGADRINIHDNEIVQGNDTLLVARGIHINNSYSPRVERNYLSGDWRVSALELDSDASNAAYIADNVINNRDTAGMVIRVRAAANTGIAIRNLMGTGDTVNIADLISAGAVKWVENYLVNDTNETGTLVPRTASSS